MTPEVWLSLNQRKQVAALVDDVACGYKWEWDDFEPMREELFENFCTDVVTQTFVDLSRLDMGSSGLLGTYLSSCMVDESKLFCYGLLRELCDPAEYNEYDRDLGLDSERYSYLREKFLTYIRNEISSQSESAEHELLISLGAVVLTRETYCIHTLDSSDSYAILRLTRLSYSDRSDVEIITPWEDEGCHEALPEGGDWLQIGGEVQEDLSYDEMLYNYYGEHEIQEDDAKANYELEVSAVFGDDITVPGPEDTEEFNPTRMGDTLFEIDESQGGI